VREPISHWKDNDFMAGWHIAKAAEFIENSSGVSI